MPEAEAGAGKRPLTTLVVPGPHADVTALAGVLAGAVVLTLAVFQLRDVPVYWQRGGHHVVADVPAQKKDLSCVSTCE